MQNETGDRVSMHLAMGFPAGNLPAIAHAICRICQMVRWVNRPLSLGTSRPGSVRLKRR